MARRSLLSFWRSGRRLMRLTAKLAAAAPVVERRPPAARPKKVPLNPGELDERLHLPPGLRRGAALVVLLHGCGQEPEALAEQAGWIVLSDRLGFILLMPRQRAENNGQRCFNWYQAGDTHRDRGEAASIHAMTLDVLARHRANPARVFVTGLSAGAAMAACLLAAYPDTFAAGATVAGLSAGCATGVIGAMTRMAGHGSTLSRAELVTRARALGIPSRQGPWPRLQVWQGLADTVVAPGNADELVLQWCGLHSLTGDGARTTPQSGLHRTSWSATGGAVAVERVLVDGLGHAFPADRTFTPLSVVPPSPVWAAGEIVRFWGLTNETITDR
jgi:poly(hydroxyalkanoate) depolymerase family esterase